MSEPKGKRKYGAPRPDKFMGTHKKFTHKRKPMEEKLQELLGENLVGVRRQGGKLELFTKDDVPPAIAVKIRKLWDREE